MKYIVQAVAFTGIVVMAFILWTLIQVVLLLWHLDFKHLEGFNAFMNRVIMPSVEEGLFPIVFFMGLGIFSIIKANHYNTDAFLVPVYSLVAVVSMVLTFIFLVIAGKKLDKDKEA